MKISVENYYSYLKEALETTVSSIKARFFVETEELMATFLTKSRCCPSKNVPWAFALITHFLPSPSKNLS